MSLVRPHEPQHWPLTPGNFSLAYTGNLLAFVQLEAFGPDDYTLFFRELAACIDARKDDDRVAVLYALDARFRSSVDLLRGISKALAQRQDKLRKTSVALALSTDNAVARAALRTVMTFAGLPYPVRVTNTVSEGVAFLETQLPGLDAQRPFETLARQIRACSATTILR